MTFLNGVVLDAEQQLELIEQYGGIEGWEATHTAPHFAAAWAWAGQHAVPVRQADGEPPGRDPQPDGRRRGRAGSRRAATCARSSRTASTSARRSSRRPGSRSRRSVDGIEQEPMDGTSFLYTFDDAERRGAAHRPVLRGDRRTGDLQGRLVGLRTARQGAVGPLAGDARPVRARLGLGSRTRTTGSSTTSRTTSRRRRTSPPRIPRSSTS